MRFSDTLTSFNGSAINAEWYGGFYDGGAEEYLKYLDYAYVTLSPTDKSSLKIEVEPETLT